MPVLLYDASCSVNLLARWACDDAADLDIKGVLAGLRVNRVETREVEGMSKELGTLGFAVTADHRLSEAVSG